MFNTPIVLIAGWAHGAAAWRPVLDCLPPGASVHVLTMPDLINTTSGAPGAALVDFLKKLPGPAVLAGWSAGGMLALEAAAGRPDLVKRLVLASATARFCGAPDYAPGMPLAQLRALRRKLQRHPEPALRDFFAMAHAPAIIAPAGLAALARDALAQGLEALTNGLDYLEQTDLRAMPDHVGSPTVIVHGRLDRIIPWPAGAYLAARIPNAQWQMLDEGHALPARCTRALAELIQS